MVSSEDYKIVNVNRVCLKPINSKKGETILVVILLVHPERVPCCFQSKGFAVNLGGCRRCGVHSSQLNRLLKLRIDGVVSSPAHQKGQSRKSHNPGYLILTDDRFNDRPSKLRECVCILTDVQETTDGPQHHISDEQRPGHMRVQDIIVKIKSQTPHHQCIQRYRWFELHSYIGYD